MMQKDEEHLLEPWLVYHGHLFGLENLSVFDHGSVSPKVRKALDRYERMGVHVDRSHKDAIAYSRKAEIMGARMRELDGMRKLRLSFPARLRRVRRAPYPVRLHLRPRGDP